MVNRAVRQGTPRAAAAVQPEKATRPLAQPSAVASRLLAEARRLRAASRVEDSLAMFRRAVQLEPTVAGIWHELGSALLGCGQLAEAVDKLGTRLDPKLASAHYHLGLAFSRQGRVEEAIAAYRAEVAVAPGLAEAQYELGALLYERRRIEPAIEALEKAAATLGNAPRGRVAAARSLIARDRREDAIALLRRALARDPKSPELMYNLAHALIRTGRFEEAERVLLHAVALLPRAAALWFELTSLRKMTSNDRPLIERITRVLRSGRHSAEDSALLYFALGKLHNDLGEYETAIRHFDAGNQIRAGFGRLDRKEFLWTVDRRIELFPGNVRSANDTGGSDTERLILIIGMPRSGTTLVEQILSSHPEVAGGGELFFWAQHGRAILSEGSAALAPSKVAVLAAGYQALLRDVSPDARRVIDKNPFNFLDLGMIRLAFPRAFVIHCRRHPVDTCLSIYTTYFGATDLSFLSNREDLVFYYGEYLRLMEHWRNALPAERFIEVDYEKLISEREAETRRLISFCELEWHEACLRPEENRREIGTASVWQARQPVYRTSMERWRNYEPWLGAFAELMPPAEAGG
jgi:tetratricopeptide (TPR) repeat protein